MYTKSVPSEGFVLHQLAESPVLLTSEELGLRINIRNGGYVPKSGFLIAQELKMLGVGNRALDIGTGETGFLANCLTTLGAAHVIATDIDQDALAWARTASNKAQDISWICCDLVPEGLKPESFDTIVSNPPQMPMPIKGHPHDYGGSEDGRAYIESIIRHSRKLLTQHGQLILLCFDFLGIDQDLGRMPLAKLIQSLGLQMTVVSRHSQTIRPGGKTEENIPWIKRMYPGYSFLQDTKGNRLHETLVLRISRP